MRILTTRPLADRAITLELDTEVGHRAAARVSAAGNALEAALASGGLTGVSEVTRSFTTVTLHYDPLRTRQAELVDEVETLLAGLEAEASTAGCHWDFPCCYAPEFAPDLTELSDRLGMAMDDIVSQHAATKFDVYAIGFLPGLPFLGDLGSGLSLPRRDTPRQRVPAGSVAIAGGLCVIYPWESPGGWHILGRCPVPLFDATRSRPALLAPGDKVSFTPVGVEEFDCLRGKFEDGSRSAEDFLRREGSS